LTCQEIVSHRKNYRMNLRAILSREKLSSAKEESLMEQRLRSEASCERRAVRAMVICLLLLIVGVTQANAQQKDKKNKNSPLPTATTNGPTIPLSDEQQIDYLVSTMLGAWQVGDVDKLRGAYADDVTIIQGPYLPPVVGWNNYLPLYQQQRARMQQVRMDRANTFIKVNGNCAWATFQWDFAAVVDGQPSASQGHTTLVMDRRGGKWLITLNHTSVAEQSAPRQPNAPGSTQPHR
jgi:ketosteroid isomerase-like protein